MNVKFGHIFAGGTVRGREEQRQGIVDHAPVRLRNARETRLPRRFPPPAKRLQRRSGRRPRHANHGNAGTPGAARERKNRFIL